ncbi:MAG: Na+/H+ antiporter NhaA [Bacteroidetes bacterium]|nr:Na+/H+ antiporter NhaA [Bacteroidota bacterium]
MAKQNPTSPHRTFSRRLEVPAALFSDFFRSKTSGSILLIICTAAAMVWANSAWSEGYHHFWHMPLTLGIGDFTLTNGLAHWINDGLMVIFFLYVGLEIKREILVGELSSLKKSMLPITAALGGMLVPALCYAVFNAGTPAIRGWGVPMATDIAFSLGVLSLLGARVPVGLKIFLSALAIVDDLGAVVVIAIFYSGQIAWDNLAMAGGILLALYFITRLRIRIPLLFTLLGIAVWFLILKSGVHATIAGVLLALVIPATTRINSSQFIQRIEGALARFKGIPERHRNTLRNPDTLTWTHQMKQACSQVETPLQRVEHGLADWVTFAIMPVFALANAGIHLHPGAVMEEITHPISLGIITGLFVGKQAGVFLFAWLAIRLGVARLPGGTRMSQLYAVSLLCGIGFTMSMFISELAFTEQAFKETAKIGILLGSILSGVAGFLLLKYLLPQKPADETETIREMEPDAASPEPQGWSAPSDPR